MITPRRDPASGQSLSSPNYKPGLRFDNIGSQTAQHVRSGFQPIRLFQPQPSRVYNPALSLRPGSHYADNGNQVGNSGGVYLNSF